MVRTSRLRRHRDLYEDQKPDEETKETVSSVLARYRVRYRQK